MEWLDYREKLGLGFNDKEKEKYFYAIISNELRTIFESGECVISADEYFKFGNMTGTIVKLNGMLNYYIDEFSEIADILLNRVKSLNEFLAYYIAFLNCQRNINNRYYSRDNFEDLLTDCLMKAHIQYEVLEDKDGYFVFPAGDPMMDENLVSNVLVWLDKYPGTKKTYVNALKPFLQEFLQNDKNLDNNKGEICKYLTSQGADPSIGGMYKSIISTYKDINDKTVKHNDKIDARLLEFLLYQTGLLIRMVLRVSGQIEGN